jgi:hypothetical protein
LDFDPLHQAESDIVDCERRAPQNKLYRDIATFVTFPHFWDWRDTYVFLVLQMGAVNEATDY